MNKVNLEIIIFNSELIVAKPELRLFDLKKRLGSVIVSGDEAKKHFDDRDYIKANGTYEAALGDLGFLLASDFCDMEEPSFISSFAFLSSIAFERGDMSQARSWINYEINYLKAVNVALIKSFKLYSGSEEVKKLNINSAHFMAMAYAMSGRAVLSSRASGNSRNYIGSAINCFNQAIGIYNNLSRDKLSDGAGLFLFSRELMMFANSLGINSSEEIQGYRLYLYDKALEYIRKIECGDDIAFRLRKEYLNAEIRIKQEETLGAILKVSMA